MGFSDPLLQHAISGPMIPRKNQYVNTPRRDCHLFRLSLASLNVNKPPETLDPPIWLCSSFYVPPRRSTAKEECISTFEDSCCRCGY